MSSIDSLAKDLYKIIRNEDKRGPKPYEPVGEVVRVDENDDKIIWVKIPGSDGETPVERTVDAKPGDRVRVRLSGGRGWLLGNASNPPTDDTVAKDALRVGRIAGKKAEIADENAEEAKREAATAKDYAEAAKVDAAVAHEAAEEAKESADEAYVAANEAKDSAHEANYAANGALTQLSVVEDVVGTLNWVSKHGEYNKTEDTEIDPNKTYFIKVNGVFTPVVNPEKSQIKRYYELKIDDSIQNYISSHLALTDEGLYVVKDDLGYKILLANDGMKVYDNEGHLVSTFGEYVRFSSEKPQYIGSDDAYIIFDPKTKQINIGGNVVLGGDMTLDKFLSEVNSLEVEYTVSEDYSQAFFTAHIFRGHDDVTEEFDPKCFTWYYKTEDGEAPINGNAGTNTGYTMTVNINELFDFEGHVITHFTHSYVDYYIEDGHAYVKADSVDPADIGEFGFTIDEHGDLIYSYDSDTVADFEITDGRLKALNQYGIFGNKLTRETAVYRKGALAKALAEKADNQDFFQAEQLIYIQMPSGTLSSDVLPYKDEWVTFDGEPVRGTPPNAETTQPTGYPKWTLKKPTYQKNFPVIFIAKQTLTKKVDGTMKIDCSQPLKDDSQTIIDGGHITTGTIDASVVNVDNIKAGNIKTGTISDKNNNNYWNLETGEFKLSPSTKIGDKTVDEKISGKIGDYDSSLNQQKVFNKLTNNGQLVGIYMNNGELYINANYIKSGTIDTARLNAEDVKTKIVKTTELTLQNISDLRNYVKLSEDGMEIVKDNVSVAQYGDVARIGKNNGKHILLSEDGFEIMSDTMSLMNIDVDGIATKDQVLTFEVKKSINSYAGRLDGIVPNSTFKVYDGTTLIHTFTEGIPEEYNYASSAGNIRLRYSVDSLHWFRCFLSTDLTDTVTIKVRYTSYYGLISATIGTRKTPSMIGDSSFVFGQDCDATEAYSFATGYECSAGGVGSFAAGMKCSAGENGIALGYEARAIEDGDNVSVAIGWGAIAMHGDQVALGRYNDYGSLTDYLIFMIGNGTSDLRRSNAFTVNNVGAVNAAGRYLVRGGPLLVTESKNKSVTLSANGYTTGISIDMTKDRHTPVAIAGWSVSGDNSSNANVYRVRLDGNNVVASIKNLKSSEITITFNVWVLYMAT